jgi:hypothetical protein
LTLKLYHSNLPSSNLLVEEPNDPNLGLQVLPFSISLAYDNLSSLKHNMSFRNAIISQRKINKSLLASTTHTFMKLKLYAITLPLQSLSNSATTSILHKIWKKKKMVVLKTLTD